MQASINLLEAALGPHADLHVNDQLAEMVNVNPARKASDIFGCGTGWPTISGMPGIRTVEMRCKGD